MIRPNLDLDALRGLVTGVTLGSFAKAAERLGRSTSALSAQMQKLEVQAGTPLLRKAGRGLEPTPAGEVLLAYARRLLALNDEAVDALRGGDLDGGVRLGVQEDFETLLPTMLAAFARAHPRVLIEARVARNRDLLERGAAGTLDLALTWGQVDELHGETLATLPMRWVVSRASMSRPPTGLVDLAAFEPPCLFRSAAVASLEGAEIGWRPAFVSASLGGLYAAVEAGLGVTARTGVGLPAGLTARAGGRDGWPPLPSIALRLHRSGGGAAAQRLEAVVREAVAEALPAA